MHRPRKSSDQSCLCYFRPPEYTVLPVAKNRDAQSTWKTYAAYWKTVPTGSYVLVLSGIFFLFATVGLMSGVMNAAITGLQLALVMAVISGIGAVGLAFAAFRGLAKLIFVVVPLFFAAIVLAAKFGERLSKLEAAADHQALAMRLRVEGILAVLMIVAGYALVISFIRREGLRVFGSLAEVRLAREVHQALVPSITRTVGAFEFCGASAPSGQVGGDLVDLIHNERTWMAYVADVSGHGVPAGMIMAMVKSAARMGDLEQLSLPLLLSRLDKVLGELSATNVFVTFACISGGEDPMLSFSLAGHLPVLHYRNKSRTVEELWVSNLPLGALPDAKFEALNVVCEPGDILAIVTDGLTEAANNQGEELGLDPLKSALAQHAAAPLADVIAALRQKSLAWGKQADDQTLLLARRI